MWAAADEDPANAGGWRAIVAIADVSFYVRPGSALDKEARKRGNSVYFPDRVVPMLPETLSAEICSLKEGEDRAALVCHLQVSKAGALKSWRFSRARVRIAANIAYEDAQAAIDGEERIEVSSPTCSMPEIPPVDPALVESTLRPLWACWRAMYAARAKRAPLELDLPERRVMLDEKGRILSVAPRERLDAHKLIEDYMIAANVAAAKALEGRQAPVMYRVHEPPGREKLVALKDYLKTFGIEFALGQVVRPETFNRIIERVGEAEFRPQVMEQILRSQTQAYYSPRNQGHFGLALGSYAHFTSPIRRYADLVVHRSLVRAFRLGDGGLADEEAAAMEVTGELISNLERRAMVAERETMDRYVAAYLADQVGEPGPVPDHRRSAVRLLRHRRGAGRRRAGAGGDPGPRLLSLRRKEPEPDRRRKRRDLYARPAPRAQDRRSRSGHRRPALRAARSGEGGGPDAAAARGARRQARAGAARPARQYPAPGAAVEIQLRHFKWNRISA